MHKKYKEMEIRYRTDITPDTEQIINVYDNSGLRRPTTDKKRIASMYANSNLIVTAWDKNELIGVSRALTDFCYCCYLSDLAVKKDFQKSGVGRRLIDLTREIIGKQTTLILLSAPTAMEYYPKVGFEKIENGFIIHRIEE